MSHPLLSSCARANKPAMNVPLLDQLSRRFTWLFSIRSSDEDVLRRGRAFILLCAVLIGSALTSSAFLIVNPPPNSSSVQMFALIAACIFNYGLGIAFARGGRVDLAGTFISGILSAILALYMFQRNIIDDVVWFFALPIFVASYAVRPALLWAIGTVNVSLLFVAYQVIPNVEVGADPFAKISTACILLGLLTGISFVQSLITQNLFRETVQSVHHMDQLRQEAELATRNAELASQAKSTFLANMSHELRTPLNAIIGYSEILMEDSEDEGTRDDLNRVHTAGQHLLALINDILDLSKIEAGRMAVYPERFELKEFLEQLIATVRPMAQRNQNALVMVVEDELGRVYTDRTKLRQVLLNLLSNAIKFTEQGAVTLRAWRDDATLVFEIEDTGIGMDEAALGRIFQDFVQADATTTRKYGGTGLGLSLTRKLLGLLDGDITATSQPDHGSRFVARLPASYKGQSLEPRGLSEESSSTHSTPREDNKPLVLVVDDDQATRDYIVHQLEREGFAVRAGADGAQGLIMARELLPSLIIMDIMMPELDGWELLHKLRDEEALRDIPVIMASILDERAAGLDAGAMDFLSKPIQRDRLVTAIRRAIGAENASGPLSVLVVEDTPDARDLIVRMVEQESNWKAHTAENGAAALAALETARPHIILLDLMMPEMDGFTFLTRLRERPAWRDVPVLVITAKTLEPDEETLLRRDTRGILAKTELNRERLIARMRDLI
jgi:signal transduction histidine kinase/DNA-binding response OmpR family regulator